MRRLSFVQVDVFAERVLAGNPLAVFPDAQGLTAELMQAVAREMNLSETTFVTPPEAGGSARVRIFTPELELPFAGHPSVGTACELVRLGVVPVREPVTSVVLELGVGPTLVEVDVEDGVPLGGTVHQGAPWFGAPVPRERAAALLGLVPDDLHPELDPLVVDTGLAYAIVPLRDCDVLGALSPVLGLFAPFEREYAEAYPCAFTGEESPWVEARGLFPNSGIPEDPATGSAAGPLAAYLARAGRLAPGERRVVLQGARIARPSHLTVCVHGGPEGIADVLVGGRVQPVLKGELKLPGELS
jgi:trans-2,3-dihydro-3-hydroxyanthranilate isomerase